VSAYERTTIQAVIGQKLDGQFQKLLSEHERPIQQKLFALKHQCTKAETLNPDFTGDANIPVQTGEGLEFIYASAKQDIADKAEVHRFTRKSFQAAQLRHGYASSPGNNSTLQTVLVMLSVMFGEALINAAFFSNAHMVASPVAALITSLLISMTNVGVCICAGYFIGRYLNYGANALDGEDSYFRNKRTLAKLQFAGFIALMVFFHTTVGLVRAQETLEQVQHSFAHYLVMLQTPEAVFLILMGACMSVIAFHKGVHSFDCPYPEIGRLQRAEEAAKQEIQGTYEFYQQEIEVQFENSDKELQAPIAEKKKAFERYNKAVSACHEAKRHLEQAVRDAEATCRGKLAELITAYSCISGEEQSIPVDALKRMVSFEKYLDVELPAFRSAPETNTFKSDLLLEKNQAVKRLAEIFQSAINQ